MPKPPTEPPSEGRKESEARMQRKGEDTDGMGRIYGFV